MRIQTIGHHILEVTDEIFLREKNRQIMKMLAFSTIAIFSVETLIMVFLELILDISKPIVWGLDGIILVVLLFPLNYFYIVLPMLRQIEEHRITNQELHKSNEILGRFFDIGAILIAYMDSDFNFLRVNKAYASSDQHDPEYYIGKNHFDLFPNEENFKIFQTVLQTGMPYSIYEKPFEYAANPERGISYWDWSLFPIKNRDDEVIELILVLNDVTEKKQTQRNLADSERRFRAVFNQTFQHISLLNPEGNVMLVNQTALHFTGANTGEILGHPLWQMPWWDSHSEEAPSLQQLVHQAANGETVRCESRVRSAGGHIAHMDMTIKPMLDDQDNPVLLICEARDISERIQAEEALIHSENEINRLYQAEILAREQSEILRSAVMAFSGSLNSGTVLDTLLDHLHKVVPYTSAHLQLLEDEEHLIVRFARGEEKWPEEKRILGERIEISEISILHSLLENRQVLYVADTATYQGSKYFPGQEYIGCWMAIPVLAGSQIIGLCILSHVTPNFFTPEMVQWAVALTNQAAVAIQNAWLFEQVRDSREHMQALSRRLVEVQETERHHIARELHDEAGQTLASLMVGLRLLERESSEQPSLVARCQELKQIADGVLENLHRLAIDLRPAALDHLGLVPALRQHTEMISNQHKIAIQFEVVGEMIHLPGDTETAIYRIVQEALTNVVRHAHATRVDILLERRNDALAVIIEDNGVGFDIKSTKATQLGMLGMRERADMLGGSITVESSIGQGVTIFLEVPCQFAS